MIPLAENLPPSSSKRLLIGLVSLMGIVLIAELLFSLYYLSTKKGSTTKPPALLAPSRTSAQIVSLLSLTPVPTGNVFTNPVRQPESTLALYTVSGRIAAVWDEAGGKGRWLVTQNTGGRLVEPILMTPETRVTLLGKENGKNVTTETTISTLKKGDSVVVSYNIDTKTRKLSITGVNLDRTR